MTHNPRNDLTRKPSRIVFFDLSRLCHSRLTVNLTHAAGALRDTRGQTSLSLKPGTHSLEALQAWECELSAAWLLVCVCYRTNCRKVAELHDLSPKSAIYYRFRPAPGTDFRGHTDALRELKATGCALATEEMGR